LSPNAVRLGLSDRPEVLPHNSSIKTVTLGFPTPLVYKRSLNLSVTVNEPGVVQIVANVIHGGV
jgi:hypothetical protein